MTCTCSRCAVCGDRNRFPVGQDASVQIRDVRQGENLYRAFNRFGPSRIQVVNHTRVIPPIVVDLGELVGLMYRSDKSRPGQPLTYIHQMEDPPHLVSNIEGTQLYIVGGSYRVTSRGIEG